MSPVNPRQRILAELAGRWPVSGAIFQWSSRLAGTTWGWFTGWIMIIGQILTTAVAAIAIQAVLPSIWSGFQIIGGSDANPIVGDTWNDGFDATQAVALGQVVAGSIDRAQDVAGDLPRRLQSQRGGDGLEKALEDLFRRRWCHA